MMIKLKSCLPLLLLGLIIPFNAFASDASSGDDLYVLIGWLIFLGAILILAAGMTNKVVIFYDMSDLVLSFSPWVLMLIAFIVINTLHEGFLSNAIWWIFVIIIPIILIIASIRMSIKYNKSTSIGLLVGPFKLLFSLLGIVSFVNLLHSWFDDNTSFKDFIVAGIIFSITGWLTKRLLNGEQVYIEKGWATPYSEDSIKEIEQQV